MQEGYGSRKEEDIQWGAIRSLQLPKFCDVDIQEKNITKTYFLRVRIFLTYRNCIR